MPISFIEKIFNALTNYKWASVSHICASFVINWLVSLLAKMV